MSYADLEAEVARRKAQTGCQEPVFVETPKNAVEGVKATTIESRCVRCGRMFMALIVENAGKVMLKQRHCVECSDILETEKAAEDAKIRREERAKAWVSRLEEADLRKYLEPFDVQKAIYGSLELFSRQVHGATTKTPAMANSGAARAKIESDLTAAISKCRTWAYCGKGLGFAGHSGHAKTRLMFALMRRLYVEEFLSVSFITATAFGDEASARFSEDSRDAKLWIERLAKVDVFFYDDMGKEKLTERVTKALFNLIDKRASARKPIFITANFGRERLIQKYEAGSEATGEPIMNRLLDCCEFIEV